MTTPKKRPQTALSVDSGVLAGRKPVMSVTQDIGEFFRAQGVLETARLLDGWYVLANDDLAVLIDTARPRVYAVHTYGRFGTFQNLIYNVDFYEQTMGLWGIVPGFRIAHKRFLPFNYDLGRGFSLSELQAFANPPGKIRFEPKRNRITMKQIPCFIDDPKTASRIVGIDMSVALTDSAIRIAVDYPQSLWTSELLTTLYPLYTNYESPAGKGHLVYYQDYQTLVRDELTLTDHTCRMPRLTFRSKHSAFRVTAESDKERGEAFRLNVVAEGSSHHDEYVIEIAPNPVTVRVNPYVNAGSPERIEISSGVKPEAVTVDGEDVRVTRHSAGEYVSSGLKLEPGKHVIKVRSGETIARRELYAIGDPGDAIVRTADALLKMQWRTPELDGLFPFKYWMDTLEPCWEGTRVDSFVCSSAICYMPRVFTNLVAAALYTGEKKYMDAVWRSVERIVAGSHEFDNGDLLSPDSYGQDGKYKQEDVRWYRPRYSIELVFHLAMASEGFRYLKDSGRADKCFDYALRYARTLLRLEMTDGGLHGMYTFPTLEISYPDKEGLGVEPSLRWLSRFTDMLRARGRDADAEPLDEFCRQVTGYFENVILPSGTYASESTMHAPAHWVNLAGLLLERYVLGGEAEWAEKVREVSKLIVLQAYAYIDQPDMYMLNEPGCAKFFADKGDFPDGLVSKGDCADRGIAQITADIHDVLGLESMQLITDYSFANRLSTSIEDNGAVCGCEINVPGYDYRKTDFSWENNHTGIGLNAYRMLTGRVL